MSKLVLIDGNAIVHRAFHAIPPHFKTKSGEITNATFGFTSTLLNIIKELRPEYIAASFDRKAKTFRHQEFAQYKAKTRFQAYDILEFSEDNIFINRITREVIFYAAYTPRNRIELQAFNGHHLIASQNSREYSDALFMTGVSAGEPDQAACTATYRASARADQGAVAAPLDA